MKGDWRRVDGLGRNGALAASRSGRTVSAQGQFTLPPGKWRLSVELMPTYPDAEAAPLALDAMLDGATHQIRVPRETGDGAWSQAVLDNRITAPVGDPIAGGVHRIALSATGGGVLVDRLVATPAEDE